MRAPRTLAAVGLVGLLAATAAAQDTVPNPEFASWSKFPKGTAVTLKSSSEFMGMSSEFTLTTTLVEVGADKLVVETATVIKAGGMEIKSPAMKRDVAKTVPLPKGVKAEDFSKAGKPPGTYEEGAETVKIGGADYKAKWFKAKANANGTDTESKMWMSEDVPGMLVKMESTTKGAVATRTVMQVVEIKKP